MVAVAAVLIASVLQNPSTSKQAEDALEERLQTFAAIEGISMVIDLPPDLKDLRQASKREGMWSLVYLSAMTDREWQEIEGVQVLFRRPRTLPSRRMQAHLELLEILGKLSDDDLRQAMEKGISFGKLPAQDRARILGWSRSWPGLTKTSVYDAPEETFDAFREASTKTNMRIVGLHKYVAVGPSGRRVEAYSSSSIEFVEADAEYQAPEAVVQFDVVLNPAPVDGDLDLGKGEVLSVRELLTRASVTFNRQYRTDERLFECKLFVSGRFSLRRFEECFRPILTPEPFRTLEPTEALGTLRNELADRMQRLDANSLPERGRRFTLQELAVRDPAAYAALKSSGVDPSAANVVVEPGFMLCLNPGIRQYVGSTNLEYNGVTRRVTQHRELGIGLGF